VVNKKGEFIGVVTLSDVERAMSAGGSADLTVDEIASKSVIVAYPDEYIHDVFVRLGTREVGRIPVVARKNPKRLLGVLQRHDVLVAYSKVIRRRPRR
jgi:CIC family chloride channel protein